MYCIMPLYIPMIIPARWSNQTNMSVSQNSNVNNVNISNIQPRRVCSGNMAIIFNTRDVSCG